MYICIFMFHYLFIPARKAQNILYSIEDCGERGYFYEIQVMRLNIAGPLCTSTTLDQSAFSVQTLRESESSQENASFTPDFIEEQDVQGFRYRNGNRIHSPRCGRNRCGNLIPTFALLGVTYQARFSAQV